MSEPREKSQAPKATEISDLASEQDDAVKGGATIVPCIRTRPDPAHPAIPGGIVPCVRDR